MGVGLPEGHPVCQCKVWAARNSKPCGSRTATFAVFQVVSGNPTKAADFMSMHATKVGVVGLQWRPRGKPRQGTAICFATFTCSCARLIAARHLQPGRRYYIAGLRRIRWCGQPRPSGPGWGGLVWPPQLEAGAARDASDIIMPCLEELGACYPGRHRPRFRCGTVPDIVQPLPGVWGIPTECCLSPPPPCGHGGKRLGHMRGPTQSYPKVDEFLQGLCDDGWARGLAACAG